MSMCPNEVSKTYLYKDQSYYGVTINPDIHKKCCYESHLPYGKLNSMLQQQTIVNMIERYFDLTYEQFSDAGIHSLNWELTQKGNQHLHCFFVGYEPESMKLFQDWAQPLYSYENRKNKVVHYTQTEVDKRYWERYITKNNKNIISNTGGERSGDSLVNHTKIR